MNGISLKTKATELSAQLHPLPPVERPPLDWATVRASLHLSADLLTAVRPLLATTDVPRLALELATGFPRNHLPPGQLRAFW
ncbi:hypothetical protein [Glutamicibacter arilaitensis]|uniref:hypothetical protein n=1 Tax=Glutamicibacter arilaitensis TaxID=256701 RepID=UPI00384D7A30